MSTLRKILVASVLFQSSLGSSIIANPPSRIVLSRSVNVGNECLPPQVIKSIQDRLFQSTFSAISSAPELQFLVPYMQTFSNLLNSPMEQWQQEIVNFLVNNQYSKEAVEVAAFLWLVQMPCESEDQMRVRIERVLEGKHQVFKLMEMINSLSSSLFRKNGTHMARYGGVARKILDKYNELNLQTQPIEGSNQQTQPIEPSKQTAELSIDPVEKTNVLASASKLVAAPTLLLAEPQKLPIERARPQPSLRVVRSASPPRRPLSNPPVILMPTESASKINLPPQGMQTAVVVQPPAQTTPSPEPIAAQEPIPVLPELPQVHNQELLVEPKLGLDRHRTHSPVDQTEKLSSQVQQQPIVQRVRKPLPIVPTLNLEVKPQPQVIAQPTIKNEVEPVEKTPESSSKPNEQSFKVDHQPAEVKNKSKKRRLSLSKSEKEAEKKKRKKPKRSLPRFTRKVTRDVENSRVPELISPEKIDSMKEECECVPPLPIFESDSDE